MSSETAQSATKPARRVRFSLSTALLLVVIFGLVLALISSQVRLSRVEEELQAFRPLSLEEVAQQFEQGTTLGPISTSVGDVRYSPNEDAYRVSFSWTDSNSAQTWSTDIKLRNDGFGRYIGEIHNTEFNNPLGRTRQYVVVVEAPSGFEP